MIEREKPDALLPTLGGQTALNLAKALHDDGTVEGLELPSLKARSAQFHPEAAPGPHDARLLIEGWVADLAA